MGSILSRRIAGVEDIDIQANSAYRFPPKSGKMTIDAGTCAELCVAVNIVHAGVNIRAPIGTVAREVVVPI